MEVSGEYTFDAPREMVWDAMQDPDVLGSAMPGGQGFEQIAENIECVAVVVLKQECRQCPRDSGSGGIQMQV